jgi:DNA-binding NtrC family response regulator
VSDTCRILIVEDNPDHREVVASRLRLSGHSVTEVCTGEEGIRYLRREPCDVVLLDLSMPGMNGLELLERIQEDEVSVESVVLTGTATISSAIASMKLGAFDFLLKPTPLDEIDETIRKAYRRKVLLERRREGRVELILERGSGEIVYRSRRMAEIMDIIDSIAPTRSTVLIEGESGTGKELIANAIHRKSMRSDRPFLATNCAAIPENLLESELFGYVKGAVTGAVARKQGLLEAANRGTFFVDEVGEMGQGMQAKLLRVLDNHGFRMLGDTRIQKVDVRFIAATNKCLADEVRAGRFREDLYYRLSPIIVKVPPLRERKEDIPVLVKHFLECSARRLPGPVEIPDEVMERLLEYDWPGNVRELANVIERTVILCRGRKLTPDSLPLPPSESRGTAVRVAPEGFGDVEYTLSEVEKNYIAHVLRRVDGNKTRAARVLGINRRMLYRKLAKHRMT